MADVETSGWGIQTKKTPMSVPQFWGMSFFGEQLEEVRRLYHETKCEFFLANRFGCLFGGRCIYLVLRYIKCQSKSKRVKSGIFWGGLVCPIGVFVQRLFFLLRKFGEDEAIFMTFFFKMGGSTTNQIRNMEPLWNPRAGCPKTR